MTEDITENRLDHFPPDREGNLFERDALRATQVNYLTKENAEFKDGGGYLTMNGKRVILHRLFPYDSPFENISVQDDRKKEIGLIQNINVFGDEEIDAIKKELDRKYFVREIVKVLDLKDRHGITTWKVKCADNEENIVEFTLRDTYASMYKVPDGKIIISDADGNRFSIPDAKKLDRSSFKKIELYL